MKLTEAERRARGEEIMARFSTPRSPADEPSSGDTYRIEQHCRGEWGRDPKLRAEFGDCFERYLAYSKASVKGLTKIIGGKA